jgi:hypothetical protein
MKKWIVLGVVAMFLGLGGGVAGLWFYKQNRPAPIWVPIPMNSEVPAAKRSELAAELKKNLLKPDILMKVSKDLGLGQLMGVGTDETAANELAQRLFVDIGETTAPTGGSVPSLNVGIKGKRKDRVVSEKVVMRLMQDVYPLLGVKAPPAKSY